MALADLIAGLLGGGQQQPSQGMAPPPVGAPDPSQDPSQTLGMMGPQPQPGTMAPPSPGGGNFLGISPRMAAALAAGLSSVRSDVMPGQGLANAMGTSMQGGTKYDTDQMAQKVALLDRAQRAKQEDDNVQHQNDVLDETKTYHAGALGVSKQNADANTANSVSLAASRKATIDKPTSAWNKPPEARVTDAEREINKFRQHRSGELGVTSPLASDAQRTQRLQQLEQDVQTYRDNIYKGMKISPADLVDSAVKGTTAATPFKPTSHDEFDEVPKGGYYVNPADGQTYIKQ